MQCYKLLPPVGVYKQLSVNSYERDTKKEFPYYQTINNVERYLACCPGCSNPIQIVNLYNNKRLEADQRVQRMHARHCTTPLKGFPAFDQTAYDECPFSNPMSFSGQSKKSKGTDDSELLSILFEHTETVLAFMRNVTGIKISENLFERMLGKFIESDGIHFRHVNKFNLPYSFLYMSGNQSINFQYLNNGDPLGLESEINRKSKYFLVQKGQIKKKEHTSGAQIRMYFTDHKSVKRQDEVVQKMTMVLHEELSGSENTITEKTIEFDSSYFFNTISKNQRLRTSAKKFYGKNT
ncbi:TPA: hypothetical protein ACGUP9_004316 [Vibrio vulnificus]